MWTARRSSLRCGLFLQRTPQLLLPLDCLQQRLEVPFAKTLRSLPQDNLEEERGPTLDRFREDLQHVPLVVAIHQDSELGKCLEIFGDFPYALWKQIIIGLWNAEE